MPGGRHKDLHDRIAVLTRELGEAKAATAAEHQVVVGTLGTLSELQRMYRDVCTAAKFHLRRWHPNGVDPNGGDGSLVELAKLLGFIAKPPTAKCEACGQEKKP